jgi:type I restriction enzyme M protein
MDITTLENWLWEAACSIRGPLDAPKYKDYILPLLFYKRLSDVYEDELGKLSQEFGDEAWARQLAQEDRALIRFYIPNGYTWPEVRKDPTQLGQRLTDAMRAIAKENPRLKGVIDIVDFNATAAGQRILDDDTLARLIEILNRQRLGLRDVEPDILGRAYEYLLRKFAEGSGQSAGEFYTPMQVAMLMAHIIDPQEGETIYDPCCGSGGLLIKAQLRLREKVAERLGVEPHDLKPGDVQRPLQLYGQEINHVTYAMAKMNAFVHDMDAEIALGDTMKGPRFATDDGSLQAFHKVTANPMWNQKFGTEVYENDTYGRFTRGTPPASSADWGWIQHMFASLTERGKMAVVLDTGAVSRGSGNQGRNKGAGRPPDLRRGRPGDKGRPRGGRDPAAGEPVLQHHCAGHYHGAEQGQGPSGRDPAHQRLQALRQGPTQELSDRRAHPADLRDLPRLAGRGRGKCSHHHRRSGAQRLQPESVPLRGQ